MSKIQLCFVVVLAVICQALASLRVFSTINDFPLDKNSRLKDHWLLYSNSPQCANLTQEAWTLGDHVLRQLAAVDGDLHDEIFGKPNDVSSCQLACVERGVRKTSSPHVFPHMKTTLDMTKDVDIDVHNWLVQTCQKVELGFLSYHTNPVDLYWINGEGNEVFLDQIHYGEKNVLWQHTTLGHVFVIRDPSRQRLMGTYVAEYSGSFPIGGTGGTRVQPLNFTENIKKDLSMEYGRAHQVKRTFTELGFAKSRLPDDVWASMAAYYYNNKDNFGREEWEQSKGFYVNWWERDAYFVNMPWDLKRYWQKRLMELVQNWIGGYELEMTDIYGMRRYEEGARLLTHVDRTTTHATSLIINVAQQNIREPWKVEIYDFADRLHEIEMSEGDIVFYESARCLHGRMKPLQGDFYVNLFSHYRPKKEGDNWYKVPNGPGSVQPLMDVGTCTAADGKVSCTKANHKMQTLSPELQTITGSQDLFKWWQHTGQKREAPVAAAGVSIPVPASVGAAAAGSGEL